MERIKRSELIKKRGYPPGIKGDILSLYLSNYPATARYLANRIGNKSKILIELCCGVGVSLGYFAKSFRKVIGVEINKRILDACKKNLAASSLLKRATLVQADIRDKSLFRTLKGDVVVYDIPYWYPKKYPKYSSSKKEPKNPDLVRVVTNIKKYICENIIIAAPREMSYQFFQNTVGECEYVKIFIAGKYDRNYIFLGNLIKKQGIHEVKVK